MSHDRTRTGCMAPCSFGQFFNNTRLAIYVSSRDGVFLDANNAFELLLGFSPGEARGSRVDAILAESGERHRFQDAIEASGVVQDYPLALRRRDGTVLLAMIDAVVWEEGGQIAGYNGMIRTRQAVMDSFRSFFNQLKEVKYAPGEEKRPQVSDSELLSRYMSDDTLDWIRKTGRDPLESNLVRASILFFDIRSSTRIAESLAPQQFASFLSELLSDIMDLVYGCKGSVNKLLGDGLMATFGCPVSHGTDAWNAVDAAMKIRDYLRTFNDVRPDFLVDEVRVGMGVATGSIFAGVIGSVRRQEYAVLGDAVNIAARLEQLTKRSDADILIDEATWLEVKDAIPCAPMYRGRLRGRETSMHIYRV